VTDEHPCAVYRCFDADGTLLYIGSSENPKRRWGEHRRMKSSTWTDQCVYRTEEWFDSLTLAVRAEGRAIAFEHPVHNQRCPWFEGNNLSWPYRVHPEHGLLSPGP
jgi:predicted GIY-YIG superfamily endonuclease